MKICGIRRIDDAQFAVECGAAAIGFVFWPDSPRFVDPYRARPIAASLPPFVTTVGVFVNQAAAYVNQVACLVRLGAVQLHGDETPSYVSSIERPVIKAVTQAGTVPDAWPRRVMLLLDVHDPVKRGGTGRPIDWRWAAGIAASRRMLLAGGLTPENAGEAVKAVQPFGIDVSSGVERSPGIKDHDRIAALFQAVRAASSADSYNPVTR